MAAPERSWKAEQERHEQQVLPYRYFAGRGLRRSATLTPQPLRFWSYAPVRAWVMALALVGLAGVLGWQVVRGEEITSTDVARAVGVALLVVVSATTRIAVSQHGVSFDVAGPRRVSCFSFIPLSAVLDAVVGSAPPDWPKSSSASSWFPGLHAVRIMYLLPDGEQAARSVWVRDPDRFGAALLGHPLWYGED